MSNGHETMSPRPEAREEDYDVGSPREFAERLAWMTVNGEPDIEQWENHIRHRDAALSLLATPKPEGQDYAENAQSNLLGLVEWVIGKVPELFDDPESPEVIAFMEKLIEVHDQNTLGEPAAPAPGTKGEV